MLVQPKFDSPLADYLDGMDETISGTAKSKRHAIVAYVDACDKFANEFDPYEYTDVESTYGFMPYSQVDACSTVREFAEDERAAASDAGFRIDMIVEDYAYGFGYDEPELLVAEMNRGLHKDVWQPLVPVVEAAWELRREFGIDTQYLDFEERPNLVHVLENSNAYEAVPSFAEYVSKHSNVDDYVNEELLVDIAMTESKLLAEPTKDDAMFTAEELKCFAVVEDFGKGFTRDSQKPAFNAHFDELYRDALLGSGEVSAQDVVHVSDLQEEIRKVSPYEIDTLTMLQQMSPRPESGTPHYLFDALQPAVEPENNGQYITEREVNMRALSHEGNVLVDLDRGVAIMPDVEDQSIRGFVLDRQDLFDAIKRAPNNQPTNELFYGGIADKAKASFSTWDVGFPMISDKMVEQGMSNIFYADSVDGLRHEMKIMTQKSEAQAGLDTKSSEQFLEHMKENGDFRLKIDMNMLEVNAAGDNQQEAEV